MTLKFRAEPAVGQNRWVVYVQSEDGLDNAVHHVEAESAEAAIEIVRAAHAAIAADPSPAAPESAA